MKFTDQLRAIDDADLDPYQFRLVMHIWRVGNCWESVRTTAGKCKMSMGKVSQCTLELLETGLIERVAVGGRMILRVCSYSEQRSPHEQMQQLNGSNRSPHEQQRSPHEQGKKSLPLEKRSPHEPKINEPLEDIYIPPDIPQIADLKSAMAQIVKTPMWAKTEREYDEGAILLTGWDATPETLTRFGEWWKENGWHSGLPELSTLVKEYRNFLSGIKASRMNGKTPDNTTWQRIVTAVTNGVFTGLSSEEKTALRSIGGVPIIKSMTPYDEPKLKSQFFQALGATV